MLLLLLIALAQSPEGGGAKAGSGGARPQNDLASYLTIAAAYGSGNRAAAVMEIRQWQPREIAASVNDLRSRAMNLRPSVKVPDDIAFATVEAAVLMHLEAGLLAQQALSLAETELQLGASTTVFEWSRRAAVEARNWAEMRRNAFKKDYGTDKPEPEIQERLDRREYYVALAAASLANGLPTTALPFAEMARRAASHDAEVQLVFGCAAESLAQEELLRHNEEGARRLRDGAARALREALTLDPSAEEARLHLGRLLVVEGRLDEAAPLLEQVEGRA
ncbi:MAG TPA: tetratricopeptide repeat protein, partial [Vicinamibacteria bacterium]|nr:tetratricopeptide repeat protein [Vicinamibacteria bacterium]